MLCQMECGAEAVVTLPRGTGEESYCATCASCVQDQAKRDVEVFKRFLSFVQARPQCAKAVPDALKALEAAEVRVTRIETILGR